MSKRPTKAYRDTPRFMGSPDARTLRILAEYVEPESRFCNQVIDRTIVFSGSARFVPLGPLMLWVEGGAPACGCLFCLGCRCVVCPPWTAPLHGGFSN